MLGFESHSFRQNLLKVQINFYLMVYYVQSDLQMKIACYLAAAFATIAILVTLPFYCASMKSRRYRSLASSALMRNTPGLCGFSHFDPRPTQTVFGGHFQPLEHLR
jgi:hypothetical protein